MSLNLAIMQPYFLPYIGYFQLMAAVDVFVVYDNIKYTKKGWINRNRLLQNGEDLTFSLPLKKDSDALDVCARFIAEDFDADGLLNKIRGAYSQAPQFASVFPLIERIMLFEDKNLFVFLHHSLTQLRDYLELKTELKISSTVPIDHTLKGQDKVLAICRALDATRYINAIGGKELYAPNVFDAAGFDLKFIKSQPVIYKQFGQDFVPWLSILDVLMFNPLDVVQGFVNTHYELIG